MCAVSLCANGYVTLEWVMTVVLRFTDTWRTIVWLAAREVPANGEHSRSRSEVGSIENSHDITGLTEQKTVSSHSHRAIRVLYSYPIKVFLLSSQFCQVSIFKL